MHKDDRTRKLSLRDIAREAGVSVSTVSRVLSGENCTAKISDKTRERILRVCESMKFRPNVHYRRLHEGFSRVIAFLYPPTIDGALFFDENVGLFLSALERRLADHGFHVIIQSTTAEFLAARKHLEILRNHTVDAVILWHVTLDKDILKDMMVEGKPMLKVAFPCDLLDDQILPDNYQGSRELTKYLIKQGHKKIAHIAGGKTAIDRDRELAYNEVMNEAGLNPLCLLGDYTFRNGYEWGGRILGQHKDATAVMCSNDMAATGCLRRLRELGVDIPSDIAITGFDGTSPAEVVEPRITTVDIRMRDIGTLCAERVVRAVTQKEKYTPERTLLKLPPLFGKARKAPY